MRRETASVWETLTPTQEKIYDFLKSPSPQCQRLRQDTSKEFAKMQIPLRSDEAVLRYFLAQAKPHREATIIR